ncbi:ferredoxin [Streptomyces sp. NPDC001407]|uniref:ferredoxin n=1 Tax=unclassified Streptomyces TaxID=2593676 RepID=UPI0033D90D37
MVWQVSVDRKLCLGSGICVALAPELFEMSEERSRVRHGETAPDETVLDAAESCPALAISVKDGTRTVGPRP